VAQKTTVTLIDDMDGKSPADETVRFALDGQAYEIDLTGDNALKLRLALAGYMQHGRKAPARAGKPAPRRDRKEPGRVREWARENGVKVNGRGRIPAKVLADFRAATRGTA
jgi:hypothetical protein